MKIKSYKKQLWPGANGKKKEKKSEWYLTGIILAGVYRIFGLVHTIQRWGAAKKPEVASHQPTFVLTNNVLTNENYVKEQLWPAKKKKKKDSY